MAFPDPRLAASLPSRVFLYTIDIIVITIHTCRLPRCKLIRKLHKSTYRRYHRTLCQCFDLRREKRAEFAFSSLNTRAVCNRTLRIELLTSHDETASTGLRLLLLDAPFDSAVGRYKHGPSSLTGCISNRSVINSYEYVSRCGRLRNKSRSRGNGIRLAGRFVPFASFVCCTLETLCIHATEALQHL